LYKIVAFSVIETNFLLFHKKPIFLPKNVLYFRTFLQESIKLLIEYTRCVPLTREMIVKQKVWYQLHKTGFYAS